MRRALWQNKHYFKLFLDAKYIHIYNAADEYMRNVLASKELSNNKSWGHVLVRFRHVAAPLGGCSSRLIRPWCCLTWDYTLGFFECASRVYLFTNMFERWFLNLHEFDVGWNAVKTFWNNNAFLMEACVSAPLPKMLNIYKINDLKNWPQIYVLSVLMTCWSYHK